MALHRAWVTYALLAVAALTGCGASRKAAPTTIATPISTTTAGATTVPARTPTVNTPSASVRNSAAAACNAKIGSEPKLSPYSRRALEAICSAGIVSSGAAVRREEAQACRALVKSTVPRSYQPAALASCPKP